MASQDVVRQLQEEAKKKAEALDLPELYYPVEDAATHLHISRAKLYRYLRDPEFQIETIEFENDRKSYVLSEDIRRLYIILHTPYLRRNQKKEDMIRPPFAAPTPPKVSAPGVPAALRPVRLQPAGSKN